MIPKLRIRIIALLILSAFFVLQPACQPAPSVTPTPTTVFTQYQLEYDLFIKYGDVFWCDSDYYPVARVGQEQINAEAQLAAIRGNAAEFSAILEQLKLPDKPDYTADEKLNIYREHKKLTYALQMAAAGQGYTYILRTGQNQGLRIEGTISTVGAVNETKRETSFNT